MFLESDKGSADTFRATQYFHSIFERLIFQLEQFRQFILVKLLYPAFNVFSQYKLQKFPLLVINQSKNISLRLRYPGRAGDGFYRKRDIFEHIKEVAFFGVYQSLQHSQFRFAVTSVGQLYQQGFAGNWARPYSP